MVGETQNAESHQGRAPKVSEAPTLLRSRGDENEGPIYSTLAPRARHFRGSLRIPREEPTSFLQAGAHAVIATLWPINDRWAAEFFPRVHRHLANGAPAAEALRLAQLESIRRSPRDGKFLWAAVQAVGY